MKYGKLLVSTMVGILFLPVVFAASSDDLTTHPGYVDYSSLVALTGGEPTVEISLKEPLLTMMTNILRDSDELAADFISKLYRVNVQVFKTDSFDSDRMTESMSNIAEDLERNDWERVVRVREDESHVDVFFKLSGAADMIYGIAIMVNEPENAVMVNIVGDISTADLSALGKRFDIDELVDIDINGQANH